MKSMNLNAMNFRQTITPGVLFLFALCLCMTFVGVEPAFAQGLSKVNTLVDNILGVLRGVSLGVVTIAFIWAGYKFLFKSAEIGECLKILGGGLLIAGASEFAGFLLN
jgi:type IV secretion system protein VirB2/type IV secretion system protein PtlA